MRSIMFQKIVLLAGIILIVISSVLLIGNLGADIFPVVLGLLGILVIGVFFLSKKKKWMGFVNIFLASLKNR
jgi:LPXTG-motif cell wall-anchored protein